METVQVPKREVQQEEDEEKVGLLQLSHTTVPELQHLDHYHSHALLKKFTKERSSGTSAVFDVVDDGSRGPSITDMLGTASSSSIHSGWLVI